MKLSKAEVLFLSPTKIDVFTGCGWDNWTRFNVERQKGKVYLKKEAGASVDQDVFKSLCKDLETVKLED